MGKLFQCLALFFFTALLAPLVDSCNKAICGAVVSKCMLMQSCNCDRKACLCCKDCIQCLAELYVECCSCVDLCPEVNPSETDVGIEKNAEKFDKADAHIFGLLTDTDETEGRWRVERFEEKWTANELTAWKLKGGGSNLPEVEDELQDLQVDASGSKSINCTVAYLSNCMSLGKCLDACRSMGASGYRFFDDGCCQCFGHTCKSNGSTERKCGKCPVDDELEFEDDEFYIHRDPEYSEEEMSSSKETEAKCQREMQNDISAV
jgi:hypothetical protein